MLLKAGEPMAEELAVVDEWESMGTEREGI